MNALINYMKDTLPRYSLKQPSTQKLITFRPFTVKEEKMLLIGNQTGSTVDFLATLEQVIKNCFDYSGDIKKLPMFDIEYFFLKLRSKSVAEITNPTIVCPITNEKIQLQINLEEIEPIFTENHSNEIKLANNIIIKMKYPCLGSLMEKQNNDYYELVIDCIEQIQTPSEIIETSSVSRSVIEEFVDLLTKEQFLKLINFIKTMPKVEYRAAYKASDNVEREIILKGIKDFFQ